MKPFGIAAVATALTIASLALSAVAPPELAALSPVGEAAALCAGYGKVSSTHSSATSSGEWGTDRTETETTRSSCAGISDKCIGIESESETERTTVDHHGESSSSESGSYNCEGTQY